MSEKQIIPQPIKTFFSILLDFATPLGNSRSMNTNLIYSFYSLLTGIAMYVLEHWCRVVAELPKDIVNNICDRIIRVAVYSLQWLSKTNITVSRQHLPPEYMNTCDHNSELCEATIRPLDVLLNPLRLHAEQFGGLACFVLCVELYCFFFAAISFTNFLSKYFAQFFEVTVALKTCLQITVKGMVFFKNVIMSTAPFPRLKDKEEEAVEEEYDEEDELNVKQKPNSLTRRIKWH